MMWSLVLADLVTLARLLEVERQDLHLPFFRYLLLEEEVGLRANKVVSLADQAAVAVANKIFHLMAALETHHPPVLPKEPMAGVEALEEVFSWAAGVVVLLQRVAMQLQLLLVTAALVNLQTLVAVGLLMRVVEAALHG